MTTLMEHTESTDTEHSLRSTFADRIMPLGMVARFAAPARFDVHQVSAFEAWLEAADTAGAPAFEIDCAMIEFIDLAAIEAIELARTTRRIELSDPSLATVITFELLAIGSPIAAPMLKAA